LRAAAKSLKDGGTASRTKNRDIGSFRLRNPWEASMLKPRSAPVILLVALLFWTAPATAQSPPPDALAAARELVAAAEKRTSAKVRDVPKAAVSNRSKSAAYSITSSAPRKD